MSLINREALLAEYDRVHVGEPGKARKLIENAPPIELRCEECEAFNKTRLLIPQPERKKGKWIYGEDEYGIDGYHCNKCGFFVPWDYAHKFINYIEDYNFCPNCGADMREETK